MPSKTFIVRAHGRTIHTRPVTFVCAKCTHMTTRDCYPGTPPKYCLSCAPKKKPKHERREERGSFHPTHNLVAVSTGKITPVCLEPNPDEKGWFWVRTALDWFSGESIILYHPSKGLQSRGVALENYQLVQIASEVEEVKQRVKGDRKGASQKNRSRKKAKNPERATVGSN